MKHPYLLTFLGLTACLALTFVAPVRPVQQNQKPASLVKPVVPKRPKPAPIQAPILPPPAAPIPIQGPTPEQLEERRWKTALEIQNTFYQVGLDFLQVQCRGEHCDIHFFTYPEALLTEGFKYRFETVIFANIQPRLKEVHVKQVQLGYVDYNLRHDSVEATWTVP
jgi:hypothetical protein